MKVLIVEDERKSSAYLKVGLEENGFIVDVAETGEDGLLMSRTYEYDVQILDIMLPGINGWDVLRLQRRDGIELPTLFLTARDSVDDRVKGLEMGADDYLPKPFAFSELVARIRTILRRGPQRHQTIIQIADLILDTSKRSVMRLDVPIQLTPKEFLLLQLLMRRAGEVLSRTYIAEQVWDLNFDSETNVVDVHIRRLRMKVDEPFDVRLIHTMRGVGYILEIRP